MSKTKKYYLGFKDETLKRFVSISISNVNKLINSGFTMFGFDNEADIPTNPIIDNGMVREMTQTEIDSANEVAEAIYQDAKSTIEKQRDNWALNIIATMKTKYPTATLTVQDISHSSEELAPLLINQGISDEDSAKLMQVKVAVGASRLPNQLHVI